ncbi:YbaK/EbsC family protein [Veillonella sp. R32]|uniref:YbaK/EbsC family protein n=1 Tax=Veillonella sp. R32 TaxID=2021312 RepID=UPI001389C10A|nr:YbaK/EbsC family protein [Veillonella sp. R32]KAF1677472.1 EbsC protein [Veillonella sp. R32]
MSFTKVKEYFETAGLGDRVKVLAHSSATVAEAAIAVGCEAKQIAKTMSFLVDESPILIVVAGDVKVDNKKFKATFQKKAKMIAFDQVESYIGHAPGGVCPFEVKPEVKTYLDVSLQRFDIVYPAAGDDHSAVKLSVAELEKYANSLGWVDIGKEL